MLIPDRGGGKSCSASARGGRPGHGEGACRKPCVPVHPPVRPGRRLWEGVGRGTSHSLRGLGVLALSLGLPSRGRPDPGRSGASWPDPGCPPPSATVSRVAPHPLRGPAEADEQVWRNLSKLRSLLAPKLLGSNLKAGPNHAQPRDPTGLPLQASNSLWGPGLCLLEEMGGADRKLSLLITKPQPHCPYTPIPCLLLGQKSLPDSIQGPSAFEPPILLLFCMSQDCPRDIKHPGPTLLTAMLLKS